MKFEITSKKSFIKHLTSKVVYFEKKVKLVKLSKEEVELFLPPKGIITFIGKEGFWGGQHLTLACI